VAWRKFGFHKVSMQPTPNAGVDGWAFMQSRCNQDGFAPSFHAVRTGEALNFPLDRVFHPDD
jgi:hypothetical protein